MDGVFGQVPAQTAYEVRLNNHKIATVAYRALPDVSLRETMILAAESRFK